MENKKETIVVVGRNYCNLLAMIRAFGMEGYKVNVLRLYKTKPKITKPLSLFKPESKSMYLNKYDSSLAENNSIVLDALLKMGNKHNKPLLVAVDDYSLEIIDNNLNKLKESFILSNINDTEGAISNMMDKNALKERAKAVGLPLLSSFRIKSKEGKLEIPNEISYPCFIKPNISTNSTKSKMGKYNSKEDLFRVLSKYAEKEDIDFLVEDFAEIKWEYSILGYSNGKESYCPGIFKVTSGGHRERKGVSITGEIVSREPFRDIIEKSNQLVSNLNYSGIFDVDIIETVDGKLYFIELNFRAGASIHLFTQEGVNIPAMYAENILENKYNRDNIKENYSLKEGQSFISEKVLMEEYIRSDISREKAIEMYKKANVKFIHDKVDIEPYKYFKKASKIASLMRVLYKVK